MDPFLTKLSNRLKASIRTTQAEWEARPAAVLIPLFHHEEVWQVLFTRRTETVNEHRGQVSFPGGAIESGDSGPQGTALREAEEEIGLEPTDVQIIGELSPLLTVTQFHITPFVGVIPWPYQFELNPVEVARVFTVPIPWLSDPSNLRTEMRTPLLSGPPIPVYYFEPYQGEIIWGATARITLNFLEILQEIN